MERTKLSGTEITVSRIGLGTWAMGGWMWGGAEESESIRTIHAALDAGVDLIDTAPVYGFGRSEEVVGKALAERGRRDSVVLATKVGLEWDEAGKVTRNSSPGRIREEIEASLRRLRTDHVDLYQVHWPDEAVPFEETARTLEELRTEGKVRAIGVSNYSPGQMAELRRAAPLASSQPPYNLFERAIDQDVLPYCWESGVTVLAYGALCRGLLSGRMSRERTFEGDDLRKVDPKFKGTRFDEHLEAVRRLDELARERYGRTVLHLAVRWILDRGVDVALWGGRRPEQMEPLGEIAGFSLDEDAMERIDRIVSETVRQPVGPGFMAPPRRRRAAP